MFKFRQANGLHYILLAPFLLLFAVMFWQGVRFSFLSYFVTASPHFGLIAGRVFALASVLSLLAGVLLSRFGKSAEEQSEKS